MARRRKSVNDIEAQARRIEQAGGSRATRAREIANRYIDNIYGTRSMQRAVARSGQTNASGNTTDYEAIQMNRPYAQNTYTGRRAPISNAEAARRNAMRLAFDNQGRRVGSLAPARYATRTGNTRLVTAGARGTRRGITISQESLDAFRRRRDAAANGLNAG